MKKILLLKKLESLKEKNFRKIKLLYQKNKTKIKNLLISKRENF